MSLTIHELGHALHYLTRWPDEIHAVDILMHDDYTEAVPVLPDDMTMGMGMAVQYLAGSMAERIAAGEKDICGFAFHKQSEKNPFEYLCDTPFRSDLDYFAFKAVVENTENISPELLAKEIELCEVLLRVHLPRVNVHQVSEALRRDGRFRVTSEVYKSTVH